MPCLFLENVPLDIQWDREKVKEFLEEVKKFCGFDLEVHVRKVTYDLFMPSGDVLEATSHGVHGFVFWHEGRHVQIREMLSEALEKLLEFHGIEHGMDITFVDLPPGISFYYGGKMIE